MRAQGALEYLIIIAAVLGISAVVVLFVTGAFTGSSAGADLSKCRLATANCQKDINLGIGSTCAYCETSCTDSTGNDLISGMPGCLEACLLCKQGLTGQGLLAKWKLDEGIGDKIYDLSGNGNNATIGPGLVWDTNCKSGSCLTTTGALNSLKIPSSTSMNSGDYFSFAGWFRPSGTFSQIYTFYSRGFQSASTGYHFIYISNSVSGIVYQYANGTEWRVLGSPAMTWSAGTWYHIAVTHDKSTKTVKYYRNGLLMGTTTYTDDALSVTSGDAYIGSYRGASYWFTGTIDNVRVYGRILSADEIFAFNRSGI